MTSASRPRHWAARAGRQAGVSRSGTVDATITERLGATSVILLVHVDTRSALPTPRPEGTSPELPSMLKPLCHEAPEIKGSLVVDHDRRREQQPQPRLLQLGMDGWLPEPVSPDVPAPVEIYPLIGGVVARNLRSEGLREGEHELAVPAEVNGPVND